MKRADLRQFLRQNPVGHPSQLVGIDISPKTIGLRFDAQRWWRKSQGPSARGRLCFEFQEVSGHLDLSILGALNDPYESDILNGFSITASEPGDWTDKTEVSILCQSPLPDPSGLYARLHSYLQHAGAGLGPRDVLNCPPGKLSRFAELTRAPHYLLARAPKKIAAFISSDLTEQKVAHYELAGEDRFSPTFIVRWHGSVFTCEKAFAEFD